MRDAGLQALPDPGAPELSTGVNGTPLFIHEANCCDCLLLNLVVKSFYKFPRMA